MKKKTFNLRYGVYLKSLPESDRLVSNRIFKRFVWFFFAHTALTAVIMFASEMYLSDWGVDAFLSLYEKSLMVYVPVFTAFITKNTIENKAKISSGTTTMVMDKTGISITNSDNDEVENG